MSRHSSSTKHRSSKHKNMEADSEAILESVKRILSQIDAMLADDVDEWEAYLGRARSAMCSLDRIHFFRYPSRLAEQQWIIQVLQDYAYHDADEGSITDIAEWCQTSWLRLLRDHAEDVDILTGLGRNWLQRSQKTLAIIHQDEGSASTISIAGETAAATAQRIQGPLYVESRGYLQPAVDFYYRAVKAADSSGTLSGDLLASAAEAYMSLGNVSPASVAEQHFSTAIKFLRRAQAVPDYTLSAHLQQFYDQIKNTIKMLEARLEQANLLKKVVDAIKDLVQDCNFDCNDSGIALQAMDNSHVALVSMMLKAEGFSPYRCDRNVALGVNLTSLTKVLRAAQNEDILTLKAEDTPDVLNLVFESSESDRLSEYDLKLMDIDQEHLGIPETEYAATISMPSTEFRRICTDLMALSESVAIEASKDGVKFSCAGDIGNGAVTLRSHTNVEKPELNVDIELTEPVALTFSLKYLVNFCKAAGLSSTVKLCLSNEVPLLVEYNLSGSSYLRFYLAPKIGDEE